MTWSSPPKNKKSGGGAIAVSKRIILGHGNRLLEGFTPEEISTFNQLLARMEQQAARH